MEYSIGITTYSYRFDIFLKSLIKDIRNLTSQEIILGINGNYKENFDEKYRIDLLSYLTNFSKIYPFIYPQFRSLAKIWNNIIINSSNDYILILNDDEKIDSNKFFIDIEKAINTYQSSFIINNNFCHFVIKKEEINKVGYFDERFLGIGWEDSEFKKRYKKILKKEILNINIEGIIDYIDRRNIIINQKKAGGKYSLFNQEVYNKNMKFIEQYPHESFYLENKNKL